MSTTNHTDIAVGAAGDSGIVNAPLGQLDAAIGNRASLTTTDKTSLVAAVNEVDAHADAVQTQVNTSLQASGVLKAGSVSATSMLADSIVTSAKIVDLTIVAGDIQDLTITGGKIAPLAVDGSRLTRDSVLSGNLMADPSHADLTPTLTYEPGGRLIWHPRTQSLLDAVLQVVENDPQNPFGNGRTLRMLTGGTQWGRYIDCRKHGIQEGDRVAGRIICRPGSATGIWRVSARCYKADGTTTSATVCNGVAFDFGGAWDGLPHELTSVASGGVFLTIEPLTAYVLIFVTRTAGTEVLSTYKMDAWKGSGLPSIFAPGPVSFITDEVKEARAGYATLAQRMNSLLPVSDRSGRETLRDWQGALARHLSTSTGIAVCALIGDSWVVRDDIRYPLMQQLQTRYGDGGPGWVNFLCCRLNSSTYRHGFTYADTGTWTEVDRDPLSLGIDIGHIISQGTGGTVTIASTGTITDAKIQYRQTPNGGSFTVAVDAGTPVTVNTAGVDNILAYNIPTQPDAIHTIVITVTAAGTANVSLIGVDLQRNVAAGGIRVHRCGASGATSADYTDVSAILWQTSFAHLGINVAAIMLGTNDNSLASIPAATYGANLQTLCDRVHAATPLCDVMLMPSADNGVTPIAAWDQAAKDAAQTKRVAYLSSYANMGLYADANARSLMADTRHPNAAGGRVISNLMLQMLQDH